MTVLVLGSSGLLGRRLVADLAGQGRDVVGCDVAAPPPGATVEADNVTYLSADITRLDQMIDVMRSHDVGEIALLSYIMGPLMSPEHRDILGACDVNVTGVTTVLEAARLSNVRRILFASTIGTYGPQSLYGDRMVTEDDAQAPKSMYGRMKVLNEAICERYEALYGLRIVRMRPSTILGPGSTIWPSKLIEPLAVGGHGSIKWGPDKRDNVIFVGDLVALLTRVLLADDVRHSVYLASAHNVTMAEFAEAVREVVPDADFDFPTPELSPTYPERFDNSRAVEEFDWHPHSLVDTIRLYLEAVRAELATG